MTLLIRDQENRELGRQEGREEGREEGRLEGQMKEKLQIAKALLIKGLLSDEEIISVTGITSEQLDALRIS